MKPLLLLTMQSAARSERRASNDSQGFGDKFPLVPLEATGKILQFPLKVSADILGKVAECLSNLDELPENAGAIVIRETSELLTYHPEWDGKPFKVILEKDGRRFSVEEWGRTPAEIEEIVEAFVKINSFQAGKDAIRSRFHDPISPEAFRKILQKEGDDFDQFKFVLRNEAGDIIGWSDIMMVGKPVILNSEAQTRKNEAHKAKIAALKQAFNERKDAGCLTEEEGEMFNSMSYPEISGEHKLIKEQQKDLRVPNRIAEVAYIMHPDECGKGGGRFVTEAAIHAARYRTSKYDRILIGVEEANTASGNLARRALKNHADNGETTWIKRDENEGSSKNYYIDFENARTPAEKKRQWELALAEYKEQQIRLLRGLVREYYQIWQQACTLPVASFRSAA